jgi:energy-coupling factor transporter ATP-binding protein EcfA2
MRIVRVHAGVLGGLHNKTLELEDGLNIVYGPNGSGKSTWHAALYAGLCGHDGQAGPGEPDWIFAEDHAPWSGGAWEVELDIEDRAGRCVRISQDLRHSRPSTARLRIDGIDGPDLSTEIATSSGIDVTRWLGLDRHSFAATAWIRQARAGDPAGAGQTALQRAVESFLGTGNIVAAIERLTRARRHHVGDPADPASPLARAEADVDRISIEAGHLAHELIQQGLWRQERDNRRMSAASAMRSLGLARAAVAQRAVEEIRARMVETPAAPANPIGAGDSLYPSRTVNTPDLFGSPIVFGAPTFGQPIGLGGSPVYDATPASVPGWPNNVHPGHELYPPAVVSTRDTEPHDSVVDAERSLRATRLAHADLQVEAEAHRAAEAERAAVERQVFEARRAAEAARREAERIVQAPDPPHDPVRPGVMDRVGAFLGLRRPVPTRPPVTAPATPTPSIVETEPEPPPATEDYQSRLETLAQRVWQARDDLARSLTGRDHPTTMDNVEQRYREYLDEVARRGAEHDRNGAVEQELADARATAAELSEGLDQRDINEYWYTADLAPYVDNVTDLNQKVADAEAGLAAVTAEVDRMRAAGDPEGQLRRAKARRERLLALDATLHQTEQLLRSALTRAFADAQAGVQRELRVLLPTLTAERSLEVKVDAFLRVHLGGAAQRQGERTRGPHSTVDEAAVLARVAIGGYLADGGELGPLLLDDVTSGADEGRVHRLLELLTRLADRRQVVLFAHDPTTRDWAKARIGTGGPHPRLHLHLASTPDDPVELYQP